jgi:hypothetical protein
MQGLISAAACCVAAAGACGVLQPAAQGHTRQGQVRGTSGSGSSVGQKMVSTHMQSIPQDDYNKMRSASEHVSPNAAAECCQSWAAGEVDACATGLSC